MKPVEKVPIRCDESRLNRVWEVKASEIDESAQISTRSHSAFPKATPEAPASHIQYKIFDLPCANLSSAQKLDIYWLAEGAGPFRLVVSLQGGAFAEADHQADTSQFDPHWIAVCGGSTGGYLALKAGVSARIGELEDMDSLHPDQPSHVQAGVDWFGSRIFSKWMSNWPNGGVFPSQPSS